MLRLWQGTREEHHRRPVIRETVASVRRLGVPTLHFSTLAISFRIAASDCLALCLGPQVRLHGMMIRDSSRLSSGDCGNWPRRNSMNRRERGRPLVRSKPMR